MTRTRLLLLVALLALVAVPVVVLLRVGDPAGSAADPAPDPTALADRQPAATDAPPRTPPWMTPTPRPCGCCTPGTPAAPTPGQPGPRPAAGAVRVRVGGGEADLRLLRRYRARGLRVTGMRTQVLALHVLEQRPHRRRVEVSDRLAGAVVVGGGRRTTLPRDAASTRVVTLVQAPGGRWRVAAVTARE